MTRIISRNIDKKITNISEHSILNRIYINRGISNKSELDYELKNLLSFETLKDIKPAVKILYEALIQKKKILIVGDFDADGATSSALAKLILNAFGAQKVDYLVPNRFEYGYGLSSELVEVARQKEPDVIVTVDNGISSISGVKLAKEYGIQVLITDHHLAGDELPEADAIINPNQPGDKFPSKNLAGVGVVFYLMLALRSYLNEKLWFEQQSIKQPNLAHFLDLVALGTVADVVPLDANNRLLVYQGLRLIKANKCRPGITELLKIAKRQVNKTSASDLGFAVGPRLNAAGRLDDMSLGIECLLATEIKAATELAQILSSLNSERQEVEKEMQEEALEKLELISIQDNIKNNSLCLYEPHWHQGVVGLLASRVKDKVNKPCIVFANEDEHTIKGSARSVKEVHIRDALALVDARYPNLIEKFGGHSMAAGLSIKKSYLSEFSLALESSIDELLQGRTIDNCIETDGQLEFSDFDLKTARLLDAAGPFGQAFPEPMFDDEFDVIEHRFVGENHLKLVLTKSGLEKNIQAIAFRVDRSLWQKRAYKIRAVFKLDINEYYHSPELQLVINYLERRD